MKLQYRSALTLFVFGCIILLAVSVVYYRLGQRQSRKVAHLSAQHTAHVIGHNLAALLKAKAETASTLARTPLLVRALIDSNAEFSALGDADRKKRIATLNERWKATDDPLDAFIQSYMTTPVAEYFQQHRRSRPEEYGEIFLTNRYGAMIATTGKLTTLAHAHKYWWLGCHADGQYRTLFDDRGFDESVQGYVLGVVVPVVEDDLVIGVLKCNLNILGALSRIVEQYANKNTGEVLIVRSGGLAVYEQNHDPLSTEVPRRLVEHMSTGEPGSVELADHGVDRLLAYAPVNLDDAVEGYGITGKSHSSDHSKGSTGESWFVVTRLAMDDVIASTTHTTAWIVAIGTLSTVLMALAALWIGRRIAAPFVQLAQHARIVGQGELGARLDIASDDELGVLAASLNDMASNLQRTMTSRDLLTKEIERRKETEEKLRQSRRASEAANSAKSEFLANMSHEIRTPMTAILGFAENLLEGDQSESENLNAIHTIRRNGEHLIEIINDILDLSKIEAGKMAVESLPCNPCRIVAEVVSLMRVRADAKGLPFNVEYIGTIPETIQTDPTRARQILVNLIGNAIKFTEVGGVRLVTRFVNETDEPRLQFDVIDTGRGMTEEQVARLFEPFLQADTSTTREFGGTGLGLTISKRFAELLGGDIIFVETKEGVGTTVRATVRTGTLDGVRMLDDPMSATVVADAANGGAKVARSDLHGLRILLAEDGPDNQRLISLVLKKAGADVAVEENGKLALEKALAAMNRRRKGDPERPFDVILMDMQMPVMDGYEATGHLSQKGYAGPIIALTAHAMEGDRDKCIKAGCDDYASKPVNRTKLIEIIQQHLVPAEHASPVAT